MSTETSLPRTTFRGFLFADLRGYSDYVEKHGDQGGVALLERYRHLVRSTISRFDGAEIRTEGDSFYVVFASASAAVSCAMDLLAAARASDPPIPVGVGIHAGEAADTGEGPVGSAVNIAARVCAKAAAGEVLVTETVRAVTRTVLPFRYVPRGSPALKGIAEPIALFSVLTPDAANGAPVRARRPPIAPIGLALGAVALATVMVGIALFVLAPRPAASVPTPSTTPSSTEPIATPSPPAATQTPSLAASPALTPAEADLVSRMAGMSADERAGCHQATSGEEAAGATVNVSCQLRPDVGASTVELALFDQPAALLTAFSSIVTAHGGADADCSKAAAGYGPWSVERVSQGHVLCYPSGGDSYIVWTYEGGDGAGIMVTAVRHDVLWQKLYDWWQGFHPLITH